METRRTEFWLSLTRVAELLGKSDKTVRRMIAGGQLQAAKVPVPTRRGETRKTFILVSDELRETEVRARVESGQRGISVLKTEEIDGEEPVTRFYLADVETIHEA
jgi:predicted DNA-binding transcriptional regulator YafY